jgi:hypothetical protein
MTENDLIESVASMIKSAYARPTVIRTAPTLTDRDIDLAFSVIARVRYHDAHEGQTQQGDER